MKRYLKNITVSALAAASLSFSSCIKETFPTNGATAGQVAQSTTALQAMVNAIPTQLVLYGQNYAQAWDFGYPAINVSLTSMTGDMVVAGNSGYDWFANWMTNVALSEDYVTGYQFWYNYYSWIKSCNDVISTLSAVAEEDMNDEQKAYLGIALAFRAQFYLDLVRLFEAKECTGSQVKNYTIPENIKGLACCIVTENTTEEQSKSNPRATVDEVYDQVIFPDLERAERMLADYTRTVKTMPDLSVVYGISARAWLERGSAGVDGAFAKAAEYARKAIDQSNYTPLTQEQWEDPTTGFNSATSNSAWMWCTSQTSEQVHNLYSFMAHMSGEEQWTNYGGKGGGRAINSKLYALISDDDFRKHSWLDPGLFDYYEYKSCRPDYKEFFDPNSAASTKLPGSLVAIKFRPGQGNYTTYTVGNAVDHPLMRVEEMYLIEAEATAASNLSNGIALLNSFMQTYRYASYNCQSADFKAFQNEIGLQARIEFWGEGIPFWYKKRLALGIDLANSNCKEDSYRFVVDGRAPWWNCQIPRTEWSSNPALIGMNNPDPSDTVENVIE